MTEKRIALKKMKKRTNTLHSVNQVLVTTFQQHIGCLYQVKKNKILRTNNERHWYKVDV